MTALCACTCIASNFEAQARVLVESFRQWHPDVPFYVLIADRPDVRPDFGGPPARLLHMQDLRIPHLRSMLRRYERKEVTVALKPSLLRYLLGRDYASVIFLDPDMLVTATLDPILTAVATHSLTLTPHIGPAWLSAGEREADERQMLRAGMFNAGVVGVSNRPETVAFLTWWEQRLATHCLEAVERGISYDQRWLDLAPGLVADLEVLRDPGCNVAYWNLPILDVGVGGDGFTVNGEPLRLFHFSGFTPSAPESVTSYFADLRVDETGPIAPLYRRYAALLLQAGWQRASTRAWRWDGWRHWARWTERRVRKVPRRLRRLFADLRARASG